MRNRLPDERGFTLIELLVVILIIGILAAIALPNFVSQRDRAQDAVAKADARNMVTHVEACFTSSQDYRKCTTENDLGKGIGVSFGSAAGQTEISSDDATAYLVTSHSKTGSTFSIEKPVGIWADRRTCSVPAGRDSAGCKNGTW